MRMRALSLPTCLYNSDFAAYHLLMISVIALAACFQSRNSPLATSLPARGVEEEKEAQGRRPACSVNLGVCSHLEEVRSEVNVF